LSGSVSSSHELTPTSNMLGIDDLVTIYVIVDSDVTIDYAVFPGVVNLTTLSIACCWLARGAGEMEVTTITLLTVVTSMLIRGYDESQTTCLYT